MHKFPITSERSSWCTVLSAYKKSRGACLYHYRSFFTSFVAYLPPPPLCYVRSSKGGRDVSLVFALVFFTSFILFSRLFAVRVIIPYLPTPGGPLPLAWVPISYHLGWLSTADICQSVLCQSKIQRVDLDLDLDLVWTWTWIMHGCVDVCM
ncbi:hypothetical protein WAI453_007611 [Rhynchosporium graminicola]